MFKKLENKLSKNQKLVLKIIGIIVAIMVAYLSVHWYYSSLIVYPVFIVVSIIGLIIYLIKKEKKILKYLYRALMALTLVYGILMAMLLISFEIYM